MPSNQSTANPSPSSTAPHQPESSAATRPRPATGRRRDKLQLSCDLCRRRKLRCDRQRPCSTCSSRGQACTYPEDSSRPPPSTAVPGMQQRLLQLERLVMSIASKPNAQPALNQNMLNTPPEIPPVDTPIDGHSDRGTMHFSASELHYVGGDHWAAILDSIADLKDHFNREEQQQRPPTTSPDQIQDDYGDTAKATGLPKRHSLLLYGGYRSIPHAELLAALPPRSIVDRYISRYFNRYELTSASIHGPTFLREYEAFWANPSSLPVLWLGLLYGMICLAVLASEVSEAAHGSESDQQSFQIDVYREKIVQCLVLGEYTNSGPYALEAMIHYVYVEFAIRTDADKNVWFLLALQVNLALRMGYHRDPSHFPGMTPLKAEMRRRVWATVLQSDILVSSQMGMPRMISDWKCDTAEPRNLNDIDLDEDTSELPPSRPESEITTSLGTITRRRVLGAIGAISDLIANVTSYTFADVLRADSILQEAAASIPPPFKMKDMTASLTDSPQVIMSRLFIGQLVYKGQIMLHRRFVLTEPTSVDDAPFLYSRKACLEASLGMLKIQHILDEETCPGGRLDVMRFRLSSMVNHQFLTATMILCSMLHRGQVLDRKADIVAALQRSRTIWVQHMPHSQEAGKAAKAIGFVLAKAGEVGEYSMDLGPSASVDPTMGRGQTMPATPSHSNAGIALEGQAMLANNTLDLLDPVKPDQSTFALDLDALDGNSSLDEWMMMMDPQTMGY